MKKEALEKIRPGKAHLSFNELIKETVSDSGQLTYQKCLILLLQFVQFV